MAILRYRSRSRSRRKQICPQISPVLEEQTAPFYIEDVKKSEIDRFLKMTTLNFSRFGKDNAQTENKNLQVVSQNEF